MVKEKRILSYFIGWLIVGFIICFLGVSNVFAEEITPTTGFKSQLGTLMTDNTIYWNTSDNYNSNLYFGTGPQYSDWGIPAYMRLVTITDVSTNYSYKISYNMTIFTPYSSTSTWDSTKIDNNYNLMVGDDLGVIKESKCTVSNTDVVNGNSGVYTTKSISCVITINQNQSNVWLSSGYFCKNCNLSSLETLGYVPQDSYMYITSPKLERFNDNSGVIIDQNQTIIDQNNKTNEELNNIKDQIQESNKETQEVIKDQFNDCHDSYNLLNYKIASTLAGSKITINNNYINVIGNWGISFLNVNLPADTYTMSWDFDILSGSNDTNSWRIQYTDDSYSKYINNGSSFTAIKQIKNIYIYFDYGSNNFNINVSNVMLNKGSISKPFEPYGQEICSNKIDETNDKLENLTGAITDTSPTDMSGLGDSAGWLPPGPVDSIINLPLTFFLNLSQSLSSECKPVSVPLPYVNKNITLPCMNSVYEKIGITGIGGFYTWVGLICSAVILFNYLLDLYHWVDKTLTMRENTMPGYYEDKWGGGA